MEPIQLQAIRKILEDELRPAMGCTEPIAVAYTAALARELLGVFPQQLTVRCSGNIIKNVKGATVPNSGGKKGIDTAAILGAVSGQSDLELEVLSVIGPTCKKNKKTARSSTKKNPTLSRIPAPWHSSIWTSTAFWSTLRQSPSPI